MAIDFPSSPTTGQVYTYAGVTYVYSAQGVWTTAGASAVGIIGGTPQGRLTLQTAVPVMTTTQSAKTTIYYTSYAGDRIPLYSGTSMVMTAFTELSVAATDTTKSPAAIGASKVNDWFIWNDAGTIRLGHGPDWTSDTVRSAGTALVMVQGIWLNNAAITNGPNAARGTYVGTTRSDGSAKLNWQLGSIAVGGGAAILGIWNCYNRVDVRTFVVESTGSWAYATAAWRAANGSSNNSVSFVSGLQEDYFQASYSPLMSSGTGVVAGVGFNSTTAYMGTVADLALTVSLASGVAMTSSLAIGYNVFTALEQATSGSSATFYGVGGAYQPGLHFGGKM